MKFARLERQVALDEGFSSHVYQDDRGFWTIGFGTRWILGEEVTAETQPITDTAARTLLRAGLWKAALDAQELFPTWSEMDDLRQEVLVNMAYNLGFRGLSRFGGLRRRALYLDFAGMADEMQYKRPPAQEPTPWYTQTGNRAKRLIEWMRTGRIS